MPLPPPLPFTILHPKLLAGVALAGFFLLALGSGIPPLQAQAPTGPNATPAEKTDKAAPKPEKDQREGPVEGEPLDSARFPNLETETIGVPNGRAILRIPPAGRANDQSPWRQLIQFKKDKRTAAKIYFASVDFDKGTLKELPVTIAAIQYWSHAWLDGKLYLGMNGNDLAVYDPSTDTLTDLGECFAGSKPGMVYQIATSPDGVLALGGGTGTNVSTYDPKNRKFTDYGKVGGEGTSAGYVYNLSIDEGFIYCAVRGTGPWELLAINRATKARAVLATCSASGFMDARCNFSEVTSATKEKTYYILENGKAEVIQPEQRKERIKDWRRPGFTGKPPEILVDDSPTYRGESSVIVHIQSPDSPETWRQAKLAVGLSSEGLLEIAALPDGRIAGVCRGYTPMVIADPRGDRHELVPLSDLSAYTVAAAGDRVFVGGYPGAKLAVYDTRKPQTSTISVPGKPGIPFDSKEANPHTVFSFMGTAGGAHVLFCMTPATDGRIYMIARRHRYFYGFSLVWCDAKTLETGVINDEGAFDHLQIGWMSPMDGGSKLLIATRVQYNKQIPGTAAEEGALFVFDVKTRKIVAKHTPLPKVASLLGVVQTGPEEVVGVGQLESGSSVLYRFNLRTGKTELTRTYRAMICGRAWSDMAVPARSNGFVLGPDGKVWAGVTNEDQDSLVFRIDPRDLACHPIGKLWRNEWSRILIDGGSFYTSGGASVQRVKGVEALLKKP